MKKTITQDIREIIQEILDYLGECCGTLMNKDSAENQLEEALKKLSKLENESWLIKAQNKMYVSQLEDLRDQIKLSKQPFIRIKDGPSSKCTGCDSPDTEGSS